MSFCDIINNQYYQYQNTASSQYRNGNCQILNTVGNFQIVIMNSIWHWEGNQLLIQLILVIPKKTLHLSGVFSEVTDWRFITIGFCSRLSVAFQVGIIILIIKKKVFWKLIKHNIISQPICFDGIRKKDLIKLRNWRTICKMYCIFIASLFAIPNLLYSIAKYSCKLTKFSTSTSEAYKIKTEFTQMVIDNIMNIMWLALNTIYENVIVGDDQQIAKLWKKRQKIDCR